MKEEKMNLVLVPSPTMDEWSKKNIEEHNKIRLSKRARVHYGPSEWKNISFHPEGKHQPQKKGKPVCWQPQNPTIIIRST